MIEVTIFLVARTAASKPYRDSHLAVSPREECCKDERILLGMSGLVSVYFQDRLPFPLHIQSN